MGYIIFVTFLRMEWNGMEWNGMEWNGMEWNQMDARLKSI